MSQEILDHLSNADAVLAQLIRVVGPRSLEPPGECHPFETLARAIAHQQLNGIAANTILKRLTDSCGQGAFPTPQMILAATEASLRAAGFSFAKIAALRDLAGKTLADVVPHATALQQLTDEEIIARLTQVRGIGRWTVEMLLMFHLDRPDVLPVDDFGIRSGFRAAYGLRRLPKPKELAAWGERWKPYRTTAAWYLWRALELERAGTLPPPAERIRLPRVRPARRRSAGKARRGPAADRLKRAAASSARLRRADARTGARRPRARRSRAPASKK